MPLSEKAVREYNRDRRRDNYLRKKYKVTLDNFRDRLVDQDFKCAICGLRRIFCGELYLDHCHSTGKIRGLLCTVCNLELGKFEKHGSIKYSHLIDPNKEYAKYIDKHHGNRRCNRRRFSEGT